MFPPIFHSVNLNLQSILLRTLQMKLNESKEKNQVICCLLCCNVRQFGQRVCVRKKSTYFGILQRFSTKQREMFNQSRQTEMIPYKTKTLPESPEVSVLNIQARSCRINDVLFINYAFSNISDKFCWRENSSINCSLN